MTTTIEQTILQLESKLCNATLHNDVETTDSLLANNWQNINANGTITTKQQSLAIMPKFQFRAITDEDVEVRVYPGAAVVTGKSTRQLVRSGDQVTTTTVLFTRVYAQLDGRWQVVSSQATPILQQN
ncbi:MAG: nuclear transport factor 2 family protein [Chloroflexota bacterium]